MGIMAALSFLLQAFALQVIRVEGVSMMDALRDGEMVLATGPWLSGMLQRGDVVICRFPEGKAAHFSPVAHVDFSWHDLYVKRLAALPGDYVEIRDGALYINGEKEENPSLSSLPRDMEGRQLGADEYFVLGDNRRISHDSRADDVGPLSRNMIVGKARFVIWPLSGIRRIQ